MVKNYIPKVNLYWPSKGHSLLSTPPIMISAQAVQVENQSGLMGRMLDFNMGNTGLKSTSSELRCKHSYKVLAYNVRHNAFLLPAYMN